MCKSSLPPLLLELSCIRWGFASMVSKKTDDTNNTKTISLQLNSTLIVRFMIVISSVRSDDESISFDRLRDS